MLFGLFWGDATLLLVLPAMIFAIIAQIRVKSTFQRYDRIATAERITGAMAARRILDENRLQDVRIERVSGHLTDHYDPRARVIRLSEATHDSISIAALGVAAHEAGHAVQHSTGYLPLRIRSAIIPVTQLGSRLAMPIFLIGLLMTAFGYTDSYGGGIIMSVGIALFSLTALFQLVTLPTEFNASTRALRTLEASGMLKSGEIGGARRVLSAAAMTYVAALAAALASLLRLVLIASRASGRRR